MDLKKFGDLEKSGEDYVSINCEKCGNPSVFCNCDSKLDVFDTILKDNCLGSIKNNVKYTDLGISTMTVCFNFNLQIDLVALKQKLHNKIIINYKPGSKKTKIPKKKGTDSFYNSFDIKIGIVDYTLTPVTISNVSIFIFPNGKVKAAGAKTINTINIMINELIDLINIPDLVAENIKIQMICSDFKIKPVITNPEGWCIKQEELKNILVKQHSLSATFSSLSRYPGINLKYPSVIEENKQISLLIFRSGSIIITGAKYARDIANSYVFITELICKHSKELFYFDINEEIKQKKKLKKLT
jgi:TATA-box binding protein (TBP) (component of TFIID and TFIIIB)